MSALLAVSVLLAGCAPRVGSSGVGKLSPTAFTDASTGVVVFSVSASEARADNQTMLMVFDQASSRPVEGARIWIDSKEDPSDFPDVHGTLNALRLPPGTYRLMPATVNVTARLRPTYLLDVRAGETTYAGELYMSSTSPLESTFFVRDRYDRDIAVASQQNPAVMARPVVKRLLRAGGSINQ
jgi:hypothetical protein